MNIELKKFGTTLISRQAGREAYAAFLPSLREAGTREMISVHFDEVITFSPSWGDEFLRPLAKNYGDRLTLIKTNNPSVIATIVTLEKSNKLKFSWN